MNEGLCEAVARGEPPARREGSPDELPAKEAAVLVLDTSIDLAGNACPERLTMDERQLMVADPLDDRPPERRRKWRWEQIEAFRLEPSVGSHFLQVQVAGQWIDVLRRPGDVSQDLTDLVGRLNARCGQDFSATPSEAKVAARWRHLNDLLRDSRPEKSTPPPSQMTARLWALLRPFRGSVLLLLALSLGAVAIDVVPPMLLKVLVDRVLQADRRNTLWDSCCNCCWPSSPACCWCAWPPRSWPFGKAAFPAASARR